MPTPDGEDFAVALLTGPLGEPRKVVEAASRASAAHGSVVQLVRPAMVAGARHVASAVQHARRAFAEERNRSDRLEVEVLLFLTGQRQIREALALGGLQAGDDAAVAVALGSRPEDALAAVAAALSLVAGPLPGPDGPADEWAALERVALLDVER